MIMDIKMQNILALENIVAFTEVSSRLYKDWVRWYHEIVIKLYKIESQGFNQAVKKYKKHDEELNITIITEAPPFPEYVDIYIWQRNMYISISCSSWDFHERHETNLNIYTTNGFPIKFTHKYSVFVSRKKVKRELTMPK